VSRPAPDLRIPVGVVVERRRASSPWIDVVWRPAAVLPGLPDTAPWTVLEGDAALARVYAGAAALALFHGDAASYRDNLATGAPLLWVVLRPSERAPPFEIVAVTADPSEGESYTEAGADLVDSVPMPASIEAAVAGFVAEHPIEQVFVKRARDRADPQRLARRTAIEKGGKP
jgi:hypothetical protein